MFGTFGGWPKLRILGQILAHNGQPIERSNFKHRECKSNSIKSLFEKTQRARRTFLWFDKVV
jgi:hypothetical protein